MSDDHFIPLPGSDRAKEYLEKKLQEYKVRQAGKGKAWEYAHPKLAHELYIVYRDACYKIDVVETVLAASETVDTHPLFKKMKAKYGADFDVECFCNACAVISLYCEL